MTSLSNLFLVPFGIRLPEKIYWCVHFKLKLTGRFYCNNTWSRKELSLLQAAPFPFPSHKGQYLNLHEDKMKLWGNPLAQLNSRESIKAFSYGSDTTLSKRVRIQTTTRERTFISKWCDTTVSDPSEKPSESSSQAMRQHILEEELQSQHSEVLPTDHTELGWRH